jgi:O-antigen/teichoic acid export membrane protein
LAYALYNTASWSFSLHLDNRPLAIMALGAGALNLGLNFLLVPPLGMLGAAVSTAVSYTALAAVCLCLGRRWLAFPLSGGLLGRAALAATVMGVALGMSQPRPHVVDLTLAALAAGALYGALLWFLGGLEAEERRFLRGAVAVAIGKMSVAGSRRRP